jgi:CRP-like cAMP-binding protein/HEAT repeat protein
MVARPRIEWARALDVRPWEWLRLLLSCLLWGTLTWGQALGGTALQALFLFGSGVENLPLMFVLSAALMVPTTALYTVALERLSIDRLFYLLLAVLIVAALSTRGVLAVVGSTGELLFVAYLAYLVLLNLGMLQFWNYVSRLFDTLEAKRLFPLIGAAASLGLLASGFTAAVLAGPLGTANLLLVWALLLAVSAGVFRLWQTSLSVGVAEPAAPTTASRVGVHALMSHPLLRCLMAASFLLILLLYLLDYQIADVYTRTFPDADELTAFLGRFTSVLSLFGFALSAWVVPCLMTRLGVRQVALVVPLLTVASSAALAVVYQLPSAILAATTRQAVVGAFDDPVQNLLLGIPGPRLQARARALLRGVIIPIAVASAGLLLLVVRGQRELIPLGLLTLVLACAYLAVSWLLRQEYVRALVTRICEGRLNLNDLPPGAVRLGPAEIRTLGQALEQADARTRAFLVDALGRLGGREALDTLRWPLTDSEASVRVAALKAVAAIGDARAVPWTTPLLTDESPAVRAAAVRATAALGGTLAAQSIEPLLEDPAGEVRAAAARALAERGAPPERTRAVAVLETLVRDGRAVERAQAATALSELGLPLPAGIRATLLDANEVEVRLAAIQAEPLPDAELSLLVRGLADPTERVRRAASERLMAAGEAVCLTLVAQFPRLPQAGAVLALGCLAQIGSPALRTEVDYRVAGEVERAARDAPLRRGLADADAPPAYALLRIALDQTYHRAIQCVVALATARSSERVAHDLTRDLAGTDVHRRANAQELLLNLLPPRCRAAVSQLSDSATATAPPAIDGIALAEYLEHPDAWVRAGAYYAIGRLRRVDLRDAVSTAHADTPLLASLAAETRVRLAGPDEPPESTAFRPTVRGGGATPSPLTVKPDDRALPGAEASKGAYTMLDQLLSLHRVPLFRELTLDQLQVLSPLLQSREYLAGEPIVQEGDEGHELFVVLAGRVRIVRERAGQTVLLAELGPQDYFGEMALLAERPRAATAFAATDCRLGVLAKEHFLAVLTERPEVGLAVIQVLSNRLASANERLAHEADDNAGLLAAYADYGGEPEAGVVSVAEPLAEEVR